MRLRKLYLDCVSDDGGVCIAYVSQLNVLGLTIAPAGVERYEPDGSRLVQRGHASLDLRHGLPAALSRLQFALGDRCCTLELEADQRTLTPSAAAPLGLRWNVELARARVVVRDLRHPGDVIYGIGYSDFVELTRTPRALALSQLEWGRVHFATGTLVYTALTRGSQAPWQSAFFWPHDAAPLPVSKLEVRHDAEHASHVLQLELPRGRTQIVLRTLRELHQGTAVDQARFPSWLERMASRAVAGATREQRWLSRAECADLGDGYAVHESVSFGNAALSTERMQTARVSAS